MSAYTVEQFADLERARRWQHALRDNDSPFEGITADTFLPRTVSLVTCDHSDIPHPQNDRCDNPKAAS